MGISNSKSDIALEILDRKQPAMLTHLPGWKGPICDSIGFFQHYGECWNDTLQMILLYTDGLKEITQPILYNKDIRKSRTRDKIAW